MKIFYFLTIFDILLWIIVPIRQIKKKYFYYFLFVEAADFLTLLLRLIFHSRSNSFYIPLSYLSFVAVLNIDFVKKFWVLLTSFFVLFFVVNIYVTLNQFFIILSFIQLLIIIKLLKDFASLFFNENLLNIFIFVIIFYEVLFVTKLLNLLLGFANAYVYFYISTISEILIGLFFCIFRSDDSRLILQLK